MHVVHDRSCVFICEAELLINPENVVGVSGAIFLESENRDNPL